MANQSGIFTTLGTLGNALVKNAIVTWHKGFEAIRPSGRLVFNPTRTERKISEHDTWVYRKFAKQTGEAQAYAASQPTKGDNLILTQGKITDSFEISKESGMYDKYNVTKDFQGMYGLGQSCAERMELDLQLFTMSMAFGSAYTNIDGVSVATTAADGLSIYNASHTIQGGTGSQTFSNTLSTVFGQTGLEAAENLFRNFIDHDGKVIQVIADTIVTTSDSTTVNLVKEYNKAMNHVEDANRGINAYQGRYDHIVYHYGDVDQNGVRDTAKKHYWLLLSRANNHNAILEISQEPRVIYSGKVQFNQNDLFQTDAHYAYGILGTQFIVGANAS